MKSVTIQTGKTLVATNVVNTLSDRTEAVRQSNASISFEGFVLDPKVTELNQRFISGEISLDEKLLLIKNLYNDS
jgi:Antitoxin VbhA